MSFSPHCNMCHVDITSNNAVFTSCGHFICQACFSSKMNMNPTICCFCNETCSCLPVDKNLPDEVKQFIESNPLELFTQAMEIFRFQEAHNQSYIEYLTTKVKEQQSFYEGKITALEAEIQRLKTTTPLKPMTSLPPIKRPDFMSRFKSTFTSTPSQSTFTPARNTTLPSRPETPSFIDRTIEKKPVNPFTKTPDTRENPMTPSIGRRGLDVPGSITRHPQLLKTPSRNNQSSTPSLPFKLLRPPKSAPVYPSNM